MFDVLKPEDEGECLDSAVGVPGESDPIPVHRDRKAGEQDQRKTAVARAPTPGSGHGRAT